MAISTDTTKRDSDPTSTSYTQKGEEHHTAQPPSMQIYPTTNPDNCPNDTGAEHSYNGTPGTYTTNLTPDPSEEQAGFKEQDLETLGQE